VIDKFHEEGHTTCSSASFSSSYSKHHELHGLNTELAESGNSELARIRLIISYMTEANAILFIATFLFVRNRLRFLNTNPELAKQIEREKADRTRHLKPFILNV
jgi:hypothetical protein